MNLWRKWIRWQRDWLSLDFQNLQMAVFKKVKKLLSWLNEIINKKKLEAKHLSKLEEIESQLENIIASMPTSQNSISTSIFAWKNLFKFWLAGFLVLVVAFGIAKVSNILFLILIAFVLSMALDSFVEGFRYIVKSRWLAVLIVYLLFLTLLVSWVLIIVPFVMDQLSSLLKWIFASISAFQEVVQQKWLLQIIRDSSLPAYFKDSLLASLDDEKVLLAIQEAIVQNVGNLVSVGSKYFGNVGQFAINVFGSFFSGFMQLFLVIILAIFFSLEKTKVVEFLGITLGYPEYIKLKMEKIYWQLGQWLKGQFRLSVAVGFSVWIGLHILVFLGVNVPDIMILSIIAAITESVPIIGPVLASIAAILDVMANNSGILPVLWVILVFIVVQQLENNILVPLIMNKALGVSPLAIFISILIGGSLFGAVGAILAIPLTVVLGLLLEDLVKIRKKK